MSTSVILLFITCLFFFAAFFIQYREFNRLGKLGKKLKIFSLTPMSNVASCLFIASLAGSISFLSKLQEEEIFSIPYWDDFWMGWLVYPALLAFLLTICPLYYIRLLSTKKLENDLDSKQRHNEVV